MLKKILLVITLGTSFYITADIRESVCIVNSDISNDGFDAHKWVANWLDNVGAESLALRLNSVDQGSFGSGFIVRINNFEPVLITNYHVVINDDMVDLEFINLEGESSIYKDCKVLYASGRSDLAIVELPMDLRNRKGLVISSSIAKDGDEVWSAGYPKLQKAGSWQLGRGTVTNQRAYIDDLGVESVDYVIQHSAIIGSGNSGGPLLLKKPTGNYEVVGVNTWSFYGRDNTYFSVPSDFLLNFYNEYQSFTNDSLKQSLEKQCNLFVENITSEERTYSKNVDFFSKDLIYKYGGRSSVSLMEDYKKNDNDEDLSDFLKQLDNSPTRAMGQAVYNRIEQKYSEKSLEFISVETEDSELAKKSPAITKFRLEDRDVRILWSFQLGEWRITDLSLDRVKSFSEKKSSDIEGLMIYSFLKIKGGTSIFTPTGIDEVGFDTNPQLYFSLEGYRYLAETFGYTFGYFYQNISFDADFIPSTGLHMLYAGIRLHFPQDVGKKNEFPYIVPFGSFAVAGGVSYENDMNSMYEKSTEDLLYTGFNCSLGLEYFLSKKVGLGLEVMYSNYGSTKYVHSLDMSNPDYNLNLSSISILLTLSIS